MLYVSHCHVGCDHSEFHDRVFHFRSKLRQGYLIMECLFCGFGLIDLWQIFVILFVSFIWLLQGSPSESNGKLPFSAWAFLSTILFGNILIFYADSIAEERYVMIVLPCPYVIVIWVKESCFCILATRLHNCKTAVLAL